MDNFEIICENAVTSLSSIEIDFREAGRLCADQLNYVIQHPQCAPTKRTFGPSRIVHRQSTRNLEANDIRVARALEKLKAFADVLMPQDAEAPVLARPVREAVHRPELFCELAGCSPEDEATPEAVATVIRAEGLANRVVVNQCEGEGALACARRLAGLLCVPVAVGSLREGRLERLR